MGTIQGYNFEIIIINIFFSPFRFFDGKFEHSCGKRKKGFAGKKDYDAIHVNVY